MYVHTGIQLHNYVHTTYLYIHTYVCMYILGTSYVCGGEQNNGELMEHEAHDWHELICWNLLLNKGNPAVVASNVWLQSLT